jgi:poly(beta-D-mannuronate) lyase
VLVVALVLVVAGAGCGSPPTPPPTPPPPPPSAAPTAAPPASAAPPVETPRVPGQLLDLTNWKLTLPTGQKGKKNKPEEIEEPELSSFTNDFFHLNDTRDGVVFTANVGGVTTSGSSYPRSELREMNGSEKASWSNTTGTHVLRVRQAVTKLPEVKPHVVTAQIHDADDDVIEVRLEGRHLLVEYDDGDHEVTLDGAYVLGTPYDLEITAAGGRVRVSYNGKRMADIDKRGSGWYFKTGSYVQSNPRRGDAPDARSQVVLYSLRVRHVP